MMNSEAKKKMISPAVVLGSLAVSTFLKLFFIGARELEYNEIFSSFLISHPFSKMMHIIVNDIHPPLYYLLLKVWSLLVGMSGFALRAFSVFSSLFLSLGFYWLLLKITKNRLVSLAGFLIIQFSPFLFNYSVLARMYMLATVFVVMACIFLIRIMESQTARFGDVAIFALSCVLAYYTNYLSMLAVAGFFFFSFLLTLHRKKSLKPIIWAFVIVLVMIAPWYPIMVKQQMQHRKIYDDAQRSYKDPDMLNYGYKAFPERPWGSYAVDMSSEPYYVTIQKRFIEMSGIPVTSRLVLRLFEYFLYGMLLIFFLFSLWKKNYASFLTVVLFAAYIAGNYLLGITGGRYFIFIAPFIIVAMALALNEMQRYKITTPLCIVVSLSVIGFSVLGTVRKASAGYCKPITQVVNVVKDHYRGGDVLIFSVHFFEVPFDYYASLAGFHPVKTGFPMSIHEWWDRQPYQGWSGPVISKNDLSRYVETLKNDKSSRAIWLVLDKSLYDPYDQLLQEMQRNFHVTKYDINFSACGDAYSKTLEENYRVYKVERDRTQ